MIKLLDAVDWNPPPDAILLDGHDIRDLQPASSDA